MTNKDFNNAKKNAIQALNDIEKSPLRMVGILNRAKIKEVKDFLTLNGIEELKLDHLCKDGRGLFCAKARALKDAELDTILDFFQEGSSCVIDTYLGTFYKKGSKVYRLVSASKFNFQAIVKSVALAHLVDELRDKTVAIKKEDDTYNKVFAKLVSCGVTPEKAVESLKAAGIA